MAFSERIQQLCPAVSNEQATELREFLVEASERLKAEPTLMASSLKTLEQEATDQGYDWDSVVMVLQQVAKASSAGDEPEQLMEAWHTCMASEGSIADFTAVLSDRFPEIHSTLGELVDMARKEHAALSGVAGGTSSWRIDPSRTSSQKKKARHKDYIEAGIAVGAFFGGTFAVNTGYMQHKLAKSAQKSYAVLENKSVNDVPRQFWHTLPEFRSDDDAKRILGYYFTGETNLGHGATVRPQKRFGFFNGSLSFDNNWDSVKYQLQKFSPFFYSKLKERTVNAENVLHGNNEDDVSEAPSYLSRASGGLNEPENSSLRSSLGGLSAQYHDLYKNMDINFRRMSYRIDSAVGDLQDKNDGISSLKDDSDISLSDLSESGKILPARSSELWNSAKSFKGIAMSDLGGDMQAAEQKAKRSISADISGMEDKELSALEDV